MNDLPESPPLNGDQSTGEAAGEGRGARLRAAREAAGLSLHDMSARLRLSLRQVQALEQDEEAALPPPPFVRGFVRNYARALGRDPSDFEVDVPPLPALDAAPPPSITPPQPQRQVLLESGRASANRRWLVAALVTLVLGALGSWLRLEHLQSAGDLIVRQAQPSLTELGALVGHHDAPSGADTRVVASAGPDTPTPAPGPASADAPASAPLAQAVPSPVAAAPLPTPAPTAPLPTAAASPAASSLVAAGNPHPLLAASAAAGGRKLALDFDADCWVEVRDENNQVLLSGMSRAGDHRDLEAHGPVRIVVGNAPATRLSWNGRPVDLAEFTRVTVARLTLDPASDHP